MFTAPDAKRARVQRPGDGYQRRMTGIVPVFPGTCKGPRPTHHLSSRLALKRCRPDIRENGLTQDRRRWERCCRCAVMQSVHV